MRSTYLVCYDIADPKRLRRVFQICRNYGTHLQYSVFECDLTLQERIELESELSREIHQDEDQVLFVDLGPVEGRGNRVIVSLGIPYSKFDSPCYVV